jgi:hypothetical protein
MSGRINSLHRSTVPLEPRSCSTRANTGVPPDANSSPAALIRTPCGIHQNIQKNSARIGANVQLEPVLNRPNNVFHAVQRSLTACTRGQRLARRSTAVILLRMFHHQPRFSAIEAPTTPVTFDTEF